MQEIRSECFVIGGDSNWGFEAVGWLQDVNTAGVGMAGCCVPGSLTDWTLKLTFQNKFISADSALKLFSFQLEKLLFILLVELEIEMSFQGVFMVIFF